MSKLILYGMDLSPPVRACLLTLNALEIPFEYKMLNLFKGEHMTEDFLKRNPQHTVPVLDDDGTWIWDSHAICAYLVSKYGKPTTEYLYPKDLALRAVVDQRMYFDASIIFMSLRNISMPFFRNKVTIVPKEKTDNVLEGYELLEAFFVDDQQRYLCGERLTIADFCCGATITSLHGIIPVDAVKYPKITAWLARLAELPYYKEANEKGATEYIGILKPGLTDIQY